MSAAHAAQNLESSSQGEEESVEYYIALCEQTLVLTPTDPNILEALSRLYKVQATHQATLSEGQPYSEPILERALDIWRAINKTSRFDKTANGIIARLEAAAIVWLKKDEDLAIREVGRVRELFNGLPNENAKQLLCLLLELISRFPSFHSLRGALADIHVILGKRLWESHSPYPLPKDWDSIKEHFSIAAPLLIEESQRDKGSETTKRIIDTLFMMTSLIHLLGDQHLANSFAESAVSLVESFVRSNPLAEAPVRYFQNRTPLCRTIGHGVSEPDCWVKMGELSWRPPQVQGIILAPEQEIMNRYALNQWSKDTCIVTAPTLTRRLSPKAVELEHNTFWLRINGGKVLYNYSGMIAVEGEWERQGRAPLLKISKGDTVKGWEIAHEKLGLPKGAWYVALHVRNQTLGDRPEDFNVSVTAQTNHREARIDNYFLAMQAIIARGGWIIRMGDKYMSPMPQFENVIDYARSEARSDAMDLFLIQNAKFYIGVSSGLYAVPIASGISSVLTNFSPMNGFAVRGDDLWIPKLLRNVSTGEFLSFKESMSPPYDFCFNDEVYRHRGVTPVHNTSEEIEEIVSEMLERFDGSLRYSKEDEALQERFKKLAAAFQPGGIRSRMGRAFLNRYESLLS